MTFSYSAVWDDTVRLLQAHGRLLAAIAGVFLFLPAVAFAIYLKPPEPVSDVPEQVFAAIQAYWIEAAPWMALQGLISMIGSAAMTRLIFAPGTTVGAALAFGLKLLPFYILLSLVVILLGLVAFVPLVLVLGAIGMATGEGPALILVAMLSLIAMLVPLLYITGRLIPSTPIMVAEGLRDPVKVLTRSFALTRGKGWAVLGLFIVVFLVGAILGGVVNALVGIVATLAAGREVGGLLTAVVSSAVGAAFGTLMIVLYAAIYRALAPSASVATAFE